MNDPDVDRAEAIHQIAIILASAYLRLRFREPTHAPGDCSETESDSCGGR